MLKNNLKLKVSLYLTIMLSIAMGLLTLLFLKHRQEDLQSVMSAHVTEVADMIVASTRYTMLVNERHIAEKIINDIARQKGLERVRVISKEGTIIHSNRKSEIMYSVEQTDEPCVQCHQTRTPLKEVPDDKRWKIAEDSRGHRVLNTMHAIRNEPSCSSASCHEHPASQTVLGIVDVAYSLDEIDQSLKSHVLHLIGLSAAFVVLFSVAIGILLKRLVFVPLKDLDDGAKRVTSGDLEPRIPVRSEDEFARVARSFNQMTTSLHESRQELQELIQTLESKVTERTKELLEARAEVAQGEKLASIGVLASGIAHELNNPLTGVLTFTSLLRKKAADGSEDAEDLDLVIRETKRCASIIKRLLDFAREKTPVKGFFNINLVVEDTLRIVERPASLAQIEITTDLDAELPPFWGDADLIKQVIMNLLVNAQQAIEGNGAISVSTRSLDADGRPHPERGQAGMIDVAITDTGCGIPQANLQRIFDPFFTSKEVGKGTGLGLSVSYGIVKAHGGMITVHSEVGQGSTFHVLLPVASPDDNTDRSSPESPA